VCFENQIRFSKHKCGFDHTFQIRYFFFANSVNFEIIIKTKFGFPNTHLDFKNRIWFLKSKFKKPHFNDENQMWFFEIRILKTEFGFQNTNTVFEIQMCVLILTIGLCQNNLHVDNMIKTKFGFQNTNTDFKNQIRISKTKYGFLF